MPTDLLWEAMADVNPWNNRSRGYVMLRAQKPEAAACPTLFRAWSPEHAKNPASPAGRRAERSESTVCCGDDDCGLPRRVLANASMG